MNPRRIEILQRASVIARGVVGVWLASVLFLLWATGGTADEERAATIVVLALAIAAPVLVWSVVEPNPATPSYGTPMPRWLRVVLFPLAPGGASGVVFFVACLAFAWLGYACAIGWKLDDDDPVQLAYACMYACTYVLLPTGVVARWLHSLPASAIGIASIAAWTAAFRFLFPAGPHDAQRLTEVGSPLHMIGCMKQNGYVMPYARDDLAVLAALALVGVLLHVPRIVRRWRELARADAAWRISFARRSDPASA